MVCLYHIRIEQARRAKRLGSSRKVGGTSVQQKQQNQDKEAVARRRELLASAAEARLKALKQTSNKNPLWSVNSQVADGSDFSQCIDSGWFTPISLCR